MGDLLVLCYHAVSERWTAPLSVTPAALQHQLMALLKRGYRATTFTRALSQAEGGKRLVVTFDDAYRSVYQLARPILSELGVPATVFVPVHFVDSGAPMAWPGTDRWLGTTHESELTGMTWSEIRSLADNGWEIGSHTLSHPRLTQIGNAALEKELVASRQRCEDRLGRTCYSLAYPYGDVDERVVRATERAGYVTAAGLPKRLDSRGPLEWPRIGVSHADSARRFALKVSPILRYVRASPGWLVIEWLRGLTRGRERIPQERAGDRPTIA